MPEMYDRLGGPDGVRTAVSVFYQRVVADPELSPWFEGIDLDRLQAHQRAFLAAAFGGPQVFSGRSLSQAHAGLEVTDAAFDRIVETLMTALDDLGVDQQAVVAVGERLEAVRGEIVTAGPGGDLGSGAAAGAGAAAAPGAGSGGCAGAVSAGAIPSAATS
ncbi:group 1 truncated hemoglobin [Agromyces sp. MMS24-K17]|uniref:group I truncated hemoglobin n=1 Tax=Agromyces sp. MMS24-K17 TaxID=3372850 RepID=UPI003754A698